MAIISEMSGPVLVIDANAESAALLLALPDAEAESWPRGHVPAVSDEAVVAAARAFLDANGIARPSLTLVCGMGHHNDVEKSLEGRASRMVRWREELRVSGGKPELSLRDTLDGWEAAPLLEAVKVAFGPALGADSGTAAILAALSLEALRDRSWNEGVTVVFADEVHTQAFMVFRERLLGLYENHADLEREVLLHDIKEVRLNWLPDEQVRAAGGHGCICGDFPPEAEGFRPTWLLGPRREALTGAGRLASACGEPLFDRCFGMLYGLERLRTEETA